MAIVAIEYKYEILKKKLEYNQILKQKLNVKQIILTYTYTNTHALCLSICMIKIIESGAHQQNIGQEVRGILKNLQS